MQFHHLKQHTSQTLLLDHHTLMLSKDLQSLPGPFRAITFDSTASPSSDNLSSFCFVLFFSQNITAAVFSQTQTHARLTKFICTHNLGSQLTVATDGIRKSLQYNIVVTLTNKQKISLTRRQEVLQSKDHT